VAWPPVALGLARLNGNCKSRTLKTELIFLTPLSKCNALGLSEFQNDGVSGGVSCSSVGNVDEDIVWLQIIFWFKTGKKERACRYAKLRQNEKPTRHTRERTEGLRGGAGKVGKERENNPNGSERGGRNGLGLWGGAT
jgi:hypothetical protein